MPFMTARKVFVFGVLAWVCVSLARGAEPPRQIAEEIREFEVLVKGKPAGTSELRITDRGDGTTQVATEVHVKLNYLVYVYRYDFRGQETWRGNRLVSTENRATDDGKKLQVRAKVDDRGCAIEVQGRTTTAPALDMTTNYWRAPDLARTKNFSLMNADQGTVYAATVERIGREQLAVGGRKVDCTHYRISGGAAAELWFDGRNRIVRQTSVEDGYPTEMRLTRVSSRQVVR
ncbi:MAG: DUF6134 family protein [Candidatus Saccharimonadales bacterium]